MSIILELLLSQHRGGSKTLTHWGTVLRLQQNRAPGFTELLRASEECGGRVDSYPGYLQQPAGGVAVLAYHGATLKESIFMLLVYL